MRASFFAFYALSLAISAAPAFALPMSLDMRVVDTGADVARRGLFDNVKLPGRAKSKMPILSDASSASLSAASAAVRPEAAKKAPESAREAADKQAIIYQKAHVKATSASNKLEGHKALIDHHKQYPVEKHPDGSQDWVALRVEAEQGKIQRAADLVKYEKQYNGLAKVEKAEKAELERLTKLAVKEARVKYVVHK